MYADDTVIYASARAPSAAAETLTKEMEGISQWLKDNHLTLNVKKTIYVLLYKTGKIDQGAIEEVGTFLGIILDSHLKFNKHINKL